MGLHKLYGQVAQADVVNLVSDLAGKVGTGDTRLSVKPYPPVTVTYGATVTINASLGTHFRITATGNCQLLAPTNRVDGQVIVVEFLSSGGSFTLSAVSTAGGVAFGSDIPALTATASGKTDVVQLLYKASVDRWWPIGYVKGF